jgi:hypothetical protein
MNKKIFFHSLIAGILAAVACIIYNRIFYIAKEEDFSKVLNPGTLILFNIAACLLAGIGYWVFTKWVRNGEVYFNFAFSILSFASVAIPIMMTLPLEIKDPQMFPGLAVPMHFFPALAWYTLRPLFVKDKQIDL